MLRYMLPAISIIYCLQVCMKVTRGNLEHICNTCNTPLKTQVEVKVEDMLQVTVGQSVQVQSLHLVMKTRYFRHQFLPNMDSVRTHRKHATSPLENQRMFIGSIIAVYYKSYTKHTNTFTNNIQYSVRISESLFTVTAKSFIETILLLVHLYLTSKVSLLIAVKFKRSTKRTMAEQEDCVMTFNNITVYILVKT